VTAAKSGEVWVWAEQRKGRLMTVSLELLGKGSELCKSIGSELAAVLITDKAEGLVKDLIAHGANRVYVIEDVRLGLYQSDAYTTVMGKLIEARKPEILLIGGTSIGRDFAPRIAARVHTGLVANCVDLHIEEINGKSQLVLVVPGFGGKMMVSMICKTRPQMATVKPGLLTAHQANPNAKGDIVKVEAEIKDDDLRARTIEILEERSAERPVEEADIVVAGGWGMRSAGGFKLIQDLANALGAAIGGTRPAVDEGWIPKECMIGHSGKTVSPKLFISLGASGAVHYTTGFTKSKVVFSIDKNPSAPIFDVSDIGIVGDVCEIISCLVKELTVVEN